VFAVDPANPRGIAVYTRNDLTGVLTPVPDSPFPSREEVNVMTLDFTAQFLFTATHNPSKISMFTVDPNTGALQEVPKSPFASSSTNSPVFLSTESSGQFLYVINFNSSQPDVSSVDSFQIDPVNLDLIPSPNGATQLHSSGWNSGALASGSCFGFAESYQEPLDIR
jgi:6-phosphogluconolactonase (cycloisomerase 2 family)